MRRISYALTRDQVLDGTKSQTRRLGWLFAQAGQDVLGVSKTMGLRRGVKPEIYGAHRFRAVRLEPLEAITEDDVVREGFPGMTPGQFIDMYRSSMRCEADTLVTVLDLGRVGPWPKAPRHSRTWLVDRYGSLSRALDLHIHHWCPCLECAGWGIQELADPCYECAGRGGYWGIPVVGAGADILLPAGGAHSA